MDVVEGGKHDVLVYLVGDDVRVIPLGQGADVLQLLRVKTFPVGLEGLQTMMALAPWRKASSRAARSKSKAGGTRGM